MPGRNPCRRLLIVILPLLLFTCCEDDKPAPGPQRPKDVVLAAEDTDPGTDTADFARIKQQGSLRVLIPGDEESFLPRAGSPASQDRQAAREFAVRHGLEIRFILVDRRDRLIPMLLEGRGDVIAAQLTVTEERAERIAFTRPTATVEEILVAARGAADVPKTTAELAGREVHVRQSSSFADTLRALAAEEAPGPMIVAVDERLDTESLVFRVSEGAIPLTVADSNLLDAIETYNDRVQRLFPIARGRQLAWAVRPDNPQLKAALDAFLVEHAMTGHTQRRFVHDLDGIKTWGEIRVLTRNNAVNYFLHRGQQRGFEYELAKLLADDLGLRLAMVVPPSRDQLIPWLLEGRGDVIAASLTVTPEREKQIAFSRPYLFVEELIVGRKGGPGIASRAELKQHPIHVRRSSNYYQTLKAMEAELGPLQIVEAPETLETEELIARVAAGEIPFTAADSHIVKLELTYRDDIEVALALTAAADSEALMDLTRGSKQIALAVRPDNPKLKARLDAFVKKIYRGVEYNVARKRYFDNPKRIAQAKSERTGAGGRLSPYDELIKKYSARYEFDWRLMTALCFQESRFDPRARSWVGAQGLFQVMPATGKAMGFTRLEDPEIGIHAGIRYLHGLLKKLDPKIEFRHRVRFAMAGYNAGIGHVADARRLARQLGRDPDKWFNHVADMMPLLQKPKYYRKARHGYCRGSEPKKYVSEIQNRYDNYVKIVKK